MTLDLWSGNFFLIVPFPDHCLLVPFKCSVTYTDEVCIGYFGIQDIGLFLRDTGIFVFFYFGIWDIQELWDRGYWNLFWDTS